MPEPKQKPKRKRRWLTYSLRSFLLVVTIGCIALGFWANRAAKQKAAIAWVKANGGIVFYDFEFEPDDDPILEPHAPGPEWAQAMLGVDYFATVISVNLGDDSSQLKEIAPLARLKNLKSLHLDDTQVADLSPLAGLRKLEWLHLHDTQVVDLSPLAGLRKLEWLHLHNTPVADLSPLAELNNLEILNLDFTQVADLSPLARLKNLKHLSFVNAHVVDLSPLAGLRNLETLELDQNLWKAPAWRTSGGLKNLETLELDRKAKQNQVKALKTALPNCHILWRL